jgi:PAS domain S-box-containing protein
MNGDKSHIPEVIHISAQDIIDNVRESVLLLDDDLRVLFANPSYYRNFKIDPQETTSKHFYELSCRWQTMTFREQLEKVVRYDTPLHNYEISCEFREEGIRDMIMNARRIQQDGTVMVLLEIDDVTETKKIAGAVGRRYQRELDENIETANSIIIRWTPDGTLKYINDFGCNYFGYGPEELFENNIAILFPVIETSGRILTALLKEISADPNRYITIDTENVKKDGSFSRVVWTNKAGRTVNGKTQEIISVGIDISRQYDLFKNLKDREEKLFSIINNLPQMIFWFDPTARITYVNNLAVEHTGYPKEYFMGKVPLQLSHIKKDRAMAVIENIAAVYASGKKVSAEMNICEANRIYKTDFIPHFDRFGKIESVIMIMHDVTDMKKAAEILQRDKAGLEKLVTERTEELVRSKRLADIGLLASTVSHELRNPLAAMRVTVESLKRKTQDPAQLRHYKVIDNKISDATKIIDNMLVYAKVRSPEMQRLPVAAIADEAILYVRKHRKTDGAVLIRKTCLCSREESVEADPLQMTQVFTNILNNAVDAVDPEKGRIEVTIECRDERHVAIGVKDNGSGISEENISRIFDPFYTDKTKGTGLGLAVCRNIVNMHHGKIEVESKVGDGSVFTVILPLKK